MESPSIFPPASASSSASCSRNESRVTVRYNWEKKTRANSTAQVLRNANLKEGLALLRYSRNADFGVQLPVLALFARVEGSVVGVKFRAISLRRSRRDSPTPSNT